MEAQAPPAAPATPESPETPETPEITDAPSAAGLARRARELLQARNAASSAFFPAESRRLAAACQVMAQRFLRGGRLLAGGRGALSSDAEHVSVEFVHPVIVGKRALPALDLSRSFRARLAALLRPDDIVMGFGPPEGDPEIAAALTWAAAHGAQTLSLGAAACPAGADASTDAEAAGRDVPEGSYACGAASADPHIHQEMMEVLYHTLWETVHVFFEHRERGHEVGAAEFLYPYLARRKQDTGTVVAEVAASIRAKAADDENLRAELAAAQGERLAAAALAMRGRLERGGKLLLFGNGGSATDANDWALDCALPPAGRRQIPALSLSMEPANITAVGNDIGVEAIFLRQLIAHAESADVAIGISTSGGSGNVIAALGEARKRGLLAVALLGYGGGEIARRGLADFSLAVPCDYIPRIQEVQASIYHVLLDLLTAPLGAGA